MKPIWLNSECDLKALIYAMRQGGRIVVLRQKNHYGNVVAEVYDEKGRRLALYGVKKEKLVEPVRQPPSALAIS
jgi:hypothetical protein